MKQILGKCFQKWMTKKLDPSSAEAAGCAELGKKTGTQAHPDVDIRPLLKKKIIKNSCSPSLIHPVALLKLVVLHSAGSLQKQRQRLSVSQWLNFYPKARVLSLVLRAGEKQHYNFFFLPAVWPLSLIHI